MGLYNEISASFICPFVSVLLISIIFPIQSSINLGWILPLSCRCFFQLELRYLAANILGNLRNHQVPGLSELSCFLSALPPAISDVIWVWSVWLHALVKPFCQFIIYKYFPWDFWFCYLICGFFLFL